MRAALIRADVVEGVVLVGENYTPPDGFEVLRLRDDEAVGPGFTRTADGWQAPAAPDPAPVEDGPDLLALAADLARVQRVVDALVVADLAPDDDTLDDVLADDVGSLDDSGGSLDDLLLGDLGALPEDELTLDDLDALLANGA